MALIQSVESSNRIEGVTVAPERFPLVVARNVGQLRATKSTMEELRQKRPRLKLSAEKYDLLRHRVLNETGGAVKVVARRKTCTYTIKLRGAGSVTMPWTT